MSEMVMMIARLSLQDRVRLIEIAHDTSDQQVKRYALRELAAYYDPPLAIFCPKLDAEQEKQI